MILRTHRSKGKQSRHRASARTQLMHSAIVHQIRPTKNFTLRKTSAVRNTRAMPRFSRRSSRQNKTCATCHGCGHQLFDANRAPQSDIAAPCDGDVRLDRALKFRRIRGVASDLLQPERAVLGICANHSVPAVSTGMVESPSCRPRAERLAISAMGRPTKIVCEKSWFRNQDAVSGSWIVPFRGRGAT